MKLQFIGTGAADFDWSKYGEPGIKGSTSTLLDDHILIDCGTTVSKALKRFNIQSTDITAIVITHNHSDHAGGLKRILEVFPDLVVIRNEEKTLGEGWGILLFDGEKIINQ